MHHGDNPQWFFVWRIGNQVFAGQKETQGSSREVRAPVTRVGKGHYASNGGENLFADSARGKRTILRNVLPDFGDVLRRKRMKGEPRFHSY